MKSLKLSLQEKVELKPSAPFHFDATFHKPDHFETPDNHYEMGIKWQTFNWKDQQIGVKFENIGDIEKPRIKVNIYSQASLSSDYVESFLKEIRYRYNLDYDLKEFYKKFKDHSDLKESIQKFHGMRPAHSSNLYEYIIIGIMLQNTIVRRTISMMNAMFENYGTLLEFDGKQLYAYWSSGDLKDVSEQDLRDLKLGYRAKSIKKVDDYFLAGSINEFSLRKAPFETQKKTLLDIYGVGPATIWYLLSDLFHQYDFFDHISPWEQKIYSKLFFEKDPENPMHVETLIKHFNQFKEYRQLAVHYIWENLWWKRKNKPVEWLEKLIRI